MVEKLKYIWMDGKLVDWDKATVHVLTHTLHYGLGAFEGIRSYATDDGRQAIFRLKDHVRRLRDSCHIATLNLPYSEGLVAEACKETLAANGLREGYVRPLAFIGEGVMGVFPGENPIRLAISVWKWGKYLGEKALEQGVRAKVSSFTRYQPNTMMTRAKLVGNYATSVLAKKEVRSLGFDEAILLDPEGFVSEGSGENIFIVRDGQIKTTPLTNILPGITRHTVMTLAADLGCRVQEQRFSRDELYIADEVFFTGTAAEVTPICEVDGRKIGDGHPGPVAQSIQKVFFDIVRGRAKKFETWLAYFDVRASNGAVNSVPAKRKPTKV